MNAISEERLSDSPFVDIIWRTQNDRAGSFVSLANNQWEMVVARYQGQTTFTVRGPETKATPAECPPEAEFLGIVFKPGVYMPHLSLKNLRDRADMVLPEATGQSFWLHGSAWQFPDFENADTLPDCRFCSRQPPFARVIIQSLTGSFAHKIVARTPLCGHSSGRDARVT